MKKVIELYKSLESGETLLPTNTNFDFWDDVYGASPSVYDREFARKYSSFLYYDFLEDDDTTLAGSKADLKADVLSILTFNQKKYAEMYRVFLVTDADDPITYNYDMTETTGAQHSETSYGLKETEYGATQFTKGEMTDTHSVAPMNSTTPAVESSDTESQRVDSTLAHTDKEKAHKDETDTDQWILTRKGNIGVQTAGDIIRIHTAYWTNQFKFMDMIFDDINAELLLLGDHNVHC